VIARDLGDVWAVFRIRGRSYRSEPRRKQRALVEQLEAFCWGVEADFQIVRVSRRWDAEQYVAGLRARTPRRADRELWLSYLERQRALVERLDPSTPVAFVCVRLADPELDLPARASRLLERTPAELVAAARERLQVRARGSLSAERLAGIYERAETVTGRVLSYLDAQPARADEVQWLIRRSFCRSLGEPEMAGLDWPQALSYAEEGRPRVIPEQGNVLRWLGETLVERHDRYLKVSSELGDCYQAGLCLGEMSHVPPFTRAAELLFSPLEEHRFGVDACLSVRFITNDQALRQAAHQIARTHNQLSDEEQSAHGAKDEGYSRADLARELHGRLAPTGEPILLGTLSLICSAPTPKELGRRLRKLREGFPHPLYRPLGDQLELFVQHLPAQRTLTVGYERPFTCEQVGAMVPHATHEAGSDTGLGLYTAHTIGGRQPVTLDLREASGTDRSPTIALLGSLGGGKTLLLQLLPYQAFVQGARIVDIDPKGDHRFHLLGEVRDRALVIVLGPDEEHAGKLDPLRIAPVNERHEAAATFLIDILPQPVEPRVQAAITGAVSRMLEIHGERACCMEVVACLEAGERPEERDAAYQLSQYCQAGPARLGFARLGDPLPAQSEEQVTYLQIRALKRARTDTVRSEMGQGQRHDRAVLQLVALYAMRILGEERERLKVLSFDEASFAVGQQLLDTLARWGRSELAVPILSTQLIGDIEDQDNLIGQWFLFAMRSPEHARRGLELLHLDVDDQRLIENLTEHYHAGRALYRDLQGRCEEIQGMRRKAVVRVAAVARSLAAQSHSAADGARFELRDYRVAGAMR
jgi:AAA-like domain